MTVDAQLLFWSETITGANDISPEIDFALGADPAEPLAPLVEAWLDINVADKQRSANESWQLEWELADDEAFSQSWSILTWILDDDHTKGVYRRSIHNVYDGQPRRYARVVLTVLSAATQSITFQMAIRPRVLIGVNK